MVQKGRKQMSHAPGREMRCARVTPAGCSIFYWIISWRRYVWPSGEKDRKEAVDCNTSCLFFSLRLQSSKKRCLEVIWVMKPKLPSYGRQFFLRGK